MDLSLKRLRQGKVQVDGDFLNARISDFAWETRLVDLKANPSYGDFVIHIKLDDGSERVLGIKSKYTFRFLNRITLRQAFESALAPYNIEVRNLGLFFSKEGSSIIHVTPVNLDHEQKEALYVKSKFAA